MAKNKNLVIVESPTKAKTISRFLGDDFNIVSSYGHLRDLPKSKLGVDVEHDFAPQYVIPRQNQKTVTALKKAAGKAENIYFATDEDREGEAIAWHLIQVFEPPAEKIKRIVFHEITEEAIKNALKSPRQIDINLVDAQQARRVLDRLVGYKLSPFLWKKVAKGLSAGRVQSVALRLVCEREKEIDDFKPQEFWVIDALFSKKNGEEFTGRLYSIGEKKLDKFALGNEKEVKEILKDIDGKEYTITRLEKKRLKRNPLPPFTTSLLQQDANRRFGYSARQTMWLAQRLYEGIELGEKGATGLITYMRTDSFNLAEKFINEARDYIKKEYGDKYLPSAPNYYKTKSKMAQEAHEAIRPTNPSLKPDDIKSYLEPNLYKIYSLIWQRALACQMTPAETEITNADVTHEKIIFRAQGTTVIFDGYLKIYPEKINDKILPALAEKETVNLKKLDPQQNFTKPAARYSEAGLIKALEERGIGRPSTYAPTIATILERKYVIKDQRRLKPTDIGKLVNEVLVNHFPVVVDYQFTAQMEDELDKIASAEKQWVPVIKEFYEPFITNLEKKDMELNKKDLTETASEHVCEKCGQPMVIKMGRFGKFLACSGFPDCRNTKPLNDDGSIRQAEAAETTNEVCDKCGAPMVRKNGRFGPFLSCSKYPDCKNIKNIQVGTDVTCPQCGQGEIVQRRSRFGKFFYSCNKYPDCKFALWAKPTGNKCPECGSLMVFAKDNHERCSSKECKFEREIST